jgi:RNA polymerase sigma-70 factor, ECF subfamily
VRPVSGLPGDAIEAAPSPDRHAAAERSADLTSAMAHLAPRERAMLWLAYAEGASHGEIAAVLGLNPGSLKTMLFRARRRLADLLRGQSEGSKR